MIPNSTAYLTLRDKSQEFLDFVVLACTAVPTTSASLLAPVPPALIRDHFKGAVDIPQLQLYAAKYQDPLSHMLVFSVFSYFEAFITSLLSEIVEFHGGEVKFQATANRRARAFLTNTLPVVVEAKRKLQEPAKSKNRASYEKHSAVLVNNGFRFPSELMAPYGVKNLIQKSKPKGSKAYEIQMLIQDALCFPLSAKDDTRINDIRNVRNAIAHGKPGATTLIQALAISKDLREIALKVDKHAVEHFFILETYA